MLGLPESTELSRPIPKNAIYSKFQMNTAERAKIDADISRIIIVNEVSSAKVNITEGEHIKSFFVLLVALKKKDFDVKSIITISKLIPQNILMILEYNDEAKLAIFHTKLMQTDWKRKENLSIQLKGLNMDAVWEDIIVQITGIEIEQGNTLDEQIAINEQNEMLEKEIARLEKLARNEKQPKKKFEIYNKILELERKI